MPFSEFEQILYPALFTAFMGVLLGWIFHVLYKHE